MTGNDLAAAVAAGKPVGLDPTALLQEVCMNYFRLRLESQDPQAVTARLAALVKVPPRGARRVIAFLAPDSAPCCEARMMLCDEACALYQGTLRADDFADAVNMLVAEGARHEMSLCALAHTPRGAALVCACASAPSRK